MKLLLIACTDDYALHPEVHMNGKVLSVGEVEDVNEYDLDKAMARSELCQEVQRVVEAAEVEIGKAKKMVE